MAEEIGNLPKWVNIVEVGQLGLVKIFPRYIHKGEAEVILLGLENPQAILVLDDWYARIFAQEHGLKIIGTVGIVLRAKVEGRLQSVLPVLHQLSAAGFRLSDRVIQEACRLAHE